MPCKIADSSVAVQPVVWPSVSLGRPSSNATQPAPQSRNADTADKQAIAELERVRQTELIQCRHAALEEGLKKGREEASAEISAASDRLAHVMGDLVSLKRRIRSQAESDVVKLSLAIAKRILHRELSTDPESIQGIVHAGLQKLQNREISSVRVCPSAMGPVRTALEKAGASSSVSVIPDPKLYSGDILFETALGELDASVETQLREIKRGFADRLGLS